MTKENLTPAASPDTTESLSGSQSESQSEFRSEPQSNSGLQRRSFLKSVGMAGAALSAGSLLATMSESEAHAQSPKSLTAGDAAILRFVAAAELLETDLWQQYAELGGITAGKPNPYQKAFLRLDGDGMQYITSNTLDEQSHAEFLNAYLQSKGADPVDLDAFRTLPSSQATGAKDTGRLTSLTSLDVDTSWYTRYRSSTNPDFGAKFPQAIEIRNQPAIPISDTDTPPSTTAPLPPTTDAERRIQAIACTAAFHFGYIEQG